MAQSKAKPLSAAIFKAWTRPVPSKLWPTLMVRAEGAPVNTLLERGIRSSTLEVYKSKVRKIHTMQGLPWSAGSSTLSRAAVKGRANTQTKTKTRLPITPATLLILKHKIKESGWTKSKKRLIWAISTALFVGSFRVSEVLAAKSSSHVRGSTLLNRNIKECSKIINGNSRNFLKVCLEEP